MMPHCMRIQKGDVVAFTGRPTFHPMADIMFAYVCAYIKSIAPFFTRAVYLIMHPSLSLFRRLLPAIACYLFITCHGLGQMQVGDQMKDYAKVFGLPSIASPYAVTLLEDKTSESSVLTPGQEPALSFLVTNNTAKPIQVAGKVDVIHYGTRGITGDFWIPEVIKFEDLPPVPISVDLPPHGSQVVEVDTTLPETFGGYAFIFDLGDVGRQFGVSVVRTFAPKATRIQFPALSLDRTAGVPILRSLGIQAVRVEVAYIPSDAPDYAARMEKLGQMLKELNDNKITTLLVLYAGISGEQPLGRSRRFLDDNNFMLPGNEDMACLPKCDADFQKFVADVTTKYGWPNGSVTAVELWNEPWEGASISGWGADMIRFRDLYTSMAKGVEQARATGAQVLITGCDSSTNAWDKLFPDGKDDFLKWFDACTIHYQGLWSPSLYRKWRGRTGPNGRVKIWDTESWVANSEDRIPSVIAGDRAAGYDRAMGVFAGNVSKETLSMVVMPDGTKKKLDVCFPWSPAVAVGAAQHFIGERGFRELLFQNGLPWVMVFDGEDKNVEDGTVVVTGDLREAFNPDALMFRNVKGLANIQNGADREALKQQIAALPPGNASNRERTILEGQLKGLDILTGASMTFADPADEFVLYDFYGNVVPAKNGTVTIPLNSHGYYVRGNGKPGAFDHLLKALKGARIEGYEPLDIAAHDFIAPVDQKPSLRLTLTNILNRPVKGSVQVSVTGLKLDVPAQIELAANETRDVLIPVTDGVPAASNTYPLSFRFDAGSDGAASLQEDLHVNVIARRTIKVDGDLSDWKGVLPITVHATEDEGPSSTVKAWLPFEKFDASQKPGLATAYLAYDDKYFYFAAKIADHTPSPGTIRFATRNDDQYFYPDIAYDMDPMTILWKKETTWKEPARENAALLLPGSPSQRSYTAWVPGLDRNNAAFAVDLDLPTDAFHRVSFYFVDWDTKPDSLFRTDGRRATKIEVLDATTGKSLALNAVSRYGPGCYATYLLAGKVRVVFRGASTMGGSLSGFFFDPLPAGDSHKPNPKDTASVHFVAMDTTTGGAWAGKYGSDGYAVFGSDPKYPAYAQVSVPEVRDKSTYKWPDGLRHYSYRKNPEMPFGSAPNFDNVQIAFNVIPEDQKPDLLPNLPGVPKGFIPYGDTDYEYALNKVADAYGGGTEIWRSRVPGMPPKDFYPRQPASPFDGAVKDGQLAVKQDDTTRIVEAAIPWKEIPLVKKAMDENKTIKFSFRVNDNDGPSMELPQGRSVSKQNTYAFHPDFVPHWANEIEFSFEK